MNQFFKQIKQSFLGADGNFSSRRLTAFLHIILMTITTIVLWVKTAGDIILLYCILTHGLFALLLLGIITVQNIITFKQGYKQS